MSGDLGNLLTGELGEAEARFSHEDFAALYGRRIAGRVRRRRAVRAAGVGGGTMLTAGALVAGVTQVPWGTLGATPGVGVGGTDCVTPSASVGPIDVTVTDGAMEASSAELIVTDVATGGVLYRGWSQSDGTWVFRDVDGTSIEASQQPDGSYVVSLNGDTVEINPPETGPSAAPSDQTTTGTFYYRVEVPDGSVSPSASDDCFTPSPAASVNPTLTIENTYSADPSLAAKPDDVIGDSPFECGFEFPTESYSTTTQSIDDVERVSPDEINAVINNLPPGFGLAGAQAIGQDDVLLVAVRDTFGYPFPDWVRGGGEPIDPMAMLDASDSDAPASGVRTAHGSTFVAVADGIVVGTIDDPSVPLAAPPVYRWIHGADFDESLVLLNPNNAFTACPGATLDGDGDGDWDLYAVAGDVVREADGTYVGPDYFWLKVGKP